MSEDNDLKRMFDAQRRIDAKLAPSFDDTLSRSLTPSRASPVDASYSPWLAVVVASVVALSIVVFVNWRQTSQVEEAGEAATSQTEIQRLNQACDSLLATIQGVGWEPAETPDSAPRQEMEWPTGTDSLLPFATVTMNSRSSP